MNASEYQWLAARTLLPTTERPVYEIDLEAVMNVLYRNARHGRLMELLKKHVFHKHPGLVNSIVTLAGEVSAPDFADSVPWHAAQVKDEDLMVLWNLVGVVGESGTLAALLGNNIARGVPTDPDELAGELGDLLWYVAALCTKFDLDLSDVMQRNIDKLKQRFPNGFTSADSIARVDVEG